MILGLLLAFGVGYALCSCGRPNCGCHHHRRPCYSCGYERCQCHMHHHRHEHHHCNHHDRRRDW